MKILLLFLFQIVIFIFRRNTILTPSYKNDIFNLLELKGKNTNTY